MNNFDLRKYLSEGKLYESEYFDAYHEAGDKLENHPNYKKLVSILKDRGFEPDGTPYSDGTGRRDVHGVWDVFKSYTTEPGSRGTTLTKANAKDINDALRQAGIKDIEAKPSNSYSFRLKINNLAEGRLFEASNPIWTIDSFEDSADISDAGPEYKTAVINIIKAKHPDISDKDLEASIEVMNVTWYNEARSNSKGSDPEEMEVSAEDFADGAIEHYEDIIVFDNNNLDEGKLLKEDIASKAISVLKSYKGEVKGLEDYIKYLMNTSDDISSSIQAVADDMNRDNDAEDSLRRDLEKLSLAENKLVKEDFGDRETSPELTKDEMIYLNAEIEDFLNNSLFNSDIVTNDRGDFDPTREERAIKHIIDILQDRVDY